ncbi:MAG: acetylornithine/succinylornithine family transaminase [Candidatus Dadabacteria bacterium]|nr:MAG: acetylornithine/succinylornithine family transaminase [Candidatus Dadabacteria bacterium]
MKDKENTLKEYNEYTVRCYPRSLGITLQRGEGSKVWDTKGREYLDFTSGIGVVSLGHCNQEILKVIKRQAGTLIHSSNVFYNMPHGEAAKRLSEASGMDKVFFCNSGAEASEAAIKFARKWGSTTNRHQIITFSGGFHGRTLATISAIDDEKVKKGFAPFLDGFTIVPPFELKAIERAITKETVAVMFEPVMGKGGVILPPQGFFEGIERLREKYGLLIILDEVQCGVGRTGKFYYYQYTDVKPDIVASAKGLGGGLPIGATLCSDEIAKCVGIGGHGTTFGGNPLCTAVAAEVTKIVSEPKFLNKVIEKGTKLIEGLRDIASCHKDIFSEIRGCGLMIGATLNIDKLEFIKALAQDGLLIIGASGNNIRIYPPLTVTEEEIEDALSRIKDVCRRRQ